MKKTILILLFTAVCCCAFAGGSTEAAKKDYDLLYIPRSVANNSNVMIDLSKNSTVSSDTTTAAFSNTSADNLALFRLSDSLKNVSGNSGLTLTITSDDGWCFVNENNPLVKRPFRIVYIQFTGTRQSDGTYNIGSGERKTLTYDSTNSKYTLSIPLSSESSDSPSNTYDIDICIELMQEGLNTSPDYGTLEQGYYTTRLNVTTNKSCTTTSGTRQAINEKINVRGYIGADPGTNTATYSFTVRETDSTYNMDLGLQNHNTIAAYRVATVSFLYGQLTGTELSGANATTDKFKIYISPGPDYKTDGIYQFIYNGSDAAARSSSNTIYYDLYIKTGASAYTSMSTASSSSIKAYEGTIGSWKLYQSGLHTYELTPKYTSQQISEAGSSRAWLFGNTEILGEDQYENEWKLEQDIYLKITSDSLNAYADHNKGMYWSYIYFTLEAK